MARAPYGLGAWGHAPATIFRSAAHRARPTECTSKPAALNFPSPAVKKCRRIVAANRRSLVAKPLQSPARAPGLQVSSVPPGARRDRELNGVAEDSGTVLPRTYESRYWECFGWRISYPAADAVKLVRVRLTLRCSTARKHSTDLQVKVRNLKCGLQARTPPAERFLPCHTLNNRQSAGA